MLQSLLIGAGNSRFKRIGGGQWVGSLTTLDIDPDSGADISHDLTTFPYPFPDSTFAEIHAYEVLEHLHQQGDYRAFFAIWSELWRITIPGGYLYATTPMWNSLWAWGDPGHTAIYNGGTLRFLSQSAYADDVGETTMSDYRHVYAADWKFVTATEEGDTFIFIMEAVK